MLKNADGRAEEFSSGAWSIPLKKVDGKGNVETEQFLPQKWELLFKSEDGETHKFLPEALSILCKKDDDFLIFELPSRAGAVFLFLLFLVSNIMAFAHIYVKTEQIQKPLSVEKIQEQEECAKECASDKKCANGCTKEKTEVMRDSLDAIYFSAVTLTTLGYGEFLPIGSEARNYVVFQLISGILILLFGVPVLASRISSW